MEYGKCLSGKHHIICITIIIVIIVLSLIDSPTKTMSIEGERRKQVSLSMAIEKWNSCTSVFSNSVRMEDDEEIEKEDK